jgi:uncharacterized protein YdaU (DUF1376 family)
MAIQKPEWFKIDAGKFLSDTLVDAMSTTELGACFRLLCRQWIDGYIPDDLHRLARLCRLDDAAMADAWVVLSDFFPAIEPGKRANRFMWLERERVVADLARKSDEGTRAARKRWDEVKNTGNAAPIAKPNGSPMPEAMQDRTRPEETTPDHTRAGQNGTEKPAGPIAVVQLQIGAHPKVGESDADVLAHRVLAILGIPDSPLLFQAVRASVMTKASHAGLTCAVAAQVIAGKGLEAKSARTPESWLGWFRDARYDQQSKQEQKDAFIKRVAEDVG